MFCLSCDKEKAGLLRDEAVTGFRWWRSHAVLFGLAVGLTGVLVFLVGILTVPKLGDELVHCHLARTIYQTGHRPAHYGLLYQSPVAKKPAVADVLWHYGLVGLWKILRGESRIVAQAYNAAYFVLLGLGAFLLGRHLYGSRVGLVAAFIACTVPLASALSILLHQDVAVAALCSFLFLFAVQRRYLLTGIFLGLSLFMKRTTYFVVPAVFLLAIFPEPGLLWDLLKHPLRHIRDNFWVRLKHVAMVLLPALVVVLPDWWFRTVNFGWRSIFPTYSPMGLRPMLGFVYDSTIPVVFYDHSSALMHPEAIVTYLGIALLAGLALYVLKRKGKAQDYHCLLIGITGVLLFVFMGRKTGLMLRYLSVLVPGLSIIAAQGFLALRSKVVKGLLLVGCACQLIVVCGYVYADRQISADSWKAYRYVRESTPPDAAILAVVAPRVVYYSNRAGQWTDGYYTYLEMPYLLWQADEDDMLVITARYGTDYIMVSREKVYDDAEVRHLGGWPKSFVEKMETWKSLRKVFDGGEVRIWEIVRPEEPHRVSPPEGEKPD